MTPVRPAWRIKPLLHPGERLMWVDRVPGRGPRWLVLAVASLALAVAIVTLSHERLRVTPIVALGLATVLAAYLRRSALRATYAATDRGRLFLVDVARTRVLDLPPDLPSTAPGPDGRGSIDLGTVDVLTLPGGGRSRSAVCLTEVADPGAVAELLRGLAKPSVVAAP